MQFDFKEALNGTNRLEADIDYVDHFLKSIIIYMQTKNISIKDFHELNFYIRMEKEDAPLLYGVYVSYTPCKFKGNVKFNEKYQLHSWSGLPYSTANLFFKQLVAKLIKMGYIYQETDLKPFGDELYEKYKIRKLISIEI